MDKNISLLELMQNGQLVKTGAKPKLPIQIPNVNDGMLDVYRIPLKYLYYNAENGRIARLFLDKIFNWNLLEMMKTQNTIS